MSTKIWDDPSLWNLTSKAHKALGYATVTLGAAAFLVKVLEHDPPGQASTAHQILGESSAVAAGAALLTGAVAHWGELSFSDDLWTWNNLHALIATSGAGFMVSAGFLGPTTSLHANLAEFGTLLMAIAIILEG